MRISVAANTAGTTPARYRRSLIEERYWGAALDPTPHSTPQRKFWFVLSGIHGDKAFYDTFSCDGRSIHSWQMTYPLSERTIYDLIAEEVQRSYMPSTKPGAGCVETRPRSRRGGAEDG